MADKNEKEENKLEPKSDLEAAELRKLELEIKALERKEKEEESTEPTRQKKLKLELKTLIWQTGRIYRVSQFVVAVSILATLVTIFTTIYNLWDSHTRDIENKAKELRERTDNLYRSDLQRVIQYPVEPKMTISDAIFLLFDLEDIVKNRNNQEEQKRQKEEIGTLLTQLIISPDVDLSVTRNVEFDRKAMKHSDSYKEYLISNPGYNRHIISKYKSVLVALNEEDPDYSITPDEKYDEIFTENDPKGKPEKNQAKFYQYISIFYAYKAHVELFDKTISNYPDLAREAEFLKGLSFCWFYAATKNNPLTIKIYGGEPKMVNWKWNEECK